MEAVAWPSRAVVCHGASWGATVASSLLAGWMSHPLAAGATIMNSVFRGGAEVPLDAEVPEGRCPSSPWARAQGRARAASPSPGPAGGDRGAELPGGETSRAGAPSLLGGCKTFLQKFPAAEGVNPARGRVQIRAACPHPCLRGGGAGEAGTASPGAGRDAMGHGGMWGREPAGGVGGRAPNAGCKSGGAGGTCRGGGSRFGGRTMLAREQMGKVIRNRQSLGTRRSLAVGAGSPGSPLRHGGSGARWMDGGGATTPGTSRCLLQKSWPARGGCPSHVRLLRAPTRRTCPMHGAGPTGRPAAPAAKRVELASPAAPWALPGGRGKPRPGVSC